MTLRSISTSIMESRPAVIKTSCSRPTTAPRAKLSLRKKQTTMVMARANSTSQPMPRPVKLSTYMPPQRAAAMMAPAIQRCSKRPEIYTAMSSTAMMP